MLERIRVAYDGEIYGIAFFNYFAVQYGDKKRLALWQCLIEVEQLTADLLQEGLIQHGVVFELDTIEMQQKGKKDAAKWIDLAWPDLIETLLPWIEPYEVKYREWAQAAQSEQNLFSLIADHETAIYQCWQLEQKGQSGIVILQAFIQQYKAS